MTRSAKDVASGVTITTTIENLRNAAGDKPATVLTDPASVLSRIFADSRWEKLDRWVLFAPIDGVKVGVVLATWSPDFATFALNKPDMHRLLDAVIADKIDAAFVVLARVSGRTRTYRGYAAAGGHEKLIASGLPTRDGYRGEFWPLPVEFVAPYLVADTSPF
jgi:hypothetical protein